MSKKKQPKNRQRPNHKSAPGVPPPSASKAKWRAYPVGLLVLVSVFVALAAMKQLTGVGNKASDNRTGITRAPMPRAPVDPIAPTPDPQHTLAGGAAGAAQNRSAATVQGGIPAPKSELERIAQSAALATAARIAGGSAVMQPGFPLPSLQGLMLGPSSYPGKVVVVNFWATWCGPCKREIPDLQDLYSEYRGRGLEILGVSLDGSTDVVKPYAEKAGINYIVLIGNPDVGGKYDVTAIPTTLVFDRQGKIARRLVGVQTRESLEAVIKSLL